jgi:amino-acid N-acetyltransferase
MQIRRASPEDRDEVASLLGQAALPALPPYFPPTNLAVALEDSSVVGVVALEVIGRVGLLRSVAVAPSHARRGVGTSLIRNLLARAHELGLRELYLLTENAQHFFERLDFVVVPRESAPLEVCSTSEYRELCPESATLMRLTLSSRYM